MLLVEWPGRFNINPTTPRHLRTPWQREVHLYGESNLVLEPGRSSGVVDAVEVIQRIADREPPSNIFLDHVHATPLANSEIAAAIVGRVSLWLAARVKSENRSRVPTGSKIPE